MEFDGPGATDLTLLQFVDGRVGMLVSNYDWSAKPDEKYEITYLLNDEGYAGESVGTKIGIRNGFMGFFPPEFAFDFAKGESLHIFLGDTRVDQLSLDGTANAMKMVGRCLTVVRAEIAAAEREKARFAHIPKDPFAITGGEALADLPRPPIPIDLGRWASQIANNYPSQALREMRQGKVGVSVTVDVSGRVKECKTSESSGHEILDNAACSGMLRYARFNPARNEVGEPIEGEFSTTINYRLN